MAPRRPRGPLVDYISDDNIEAAQRPKDEIEARCAALIDHPKAYRAGRVASTREMVVRSTYVVIYAEFENAVRILRVLHGARQWPP